MAAILEVFFHFLKKLMRLSPMKLVSYAKLNMSLSAVTINSVGISCTPLLPFNASILLAKQWRKCQPQTELPPNTFCLAPRSVAFEEYYDQIQEYLQLLSDMDELLVGICSYNMNRHTSYIFLKSSEMLIKLSPRTRKINHSG